MENNNSKLEKFMEMAKSYYGTKDYKKSIDCYNEVL